ncbi:hypothetical protein CDAR_292481 [Caerostris darwini]|uniref:Uncharacterized protein n=1 Tax=Caerostris darwini TaxID=1538125 RepID=A0AAV4QI43_9ARAC|nr:hypothetical protein CDAR_292481 [Caerostris darwini]
MEDLLEDHSSGISPSQIEFFSCYIFQTYFSSMGYIPDIDIEGNCQIDKFMLECVSLFHYIYNSFNIFFRGIFKNEIMKDFRDFCKSLKDFSSYAYRKCNSWELFLSLNIFERIFATLVFVSILRDVCFLERIHDHKTIIMECHRAWTLYLNRIYEQFCEQGGWKTLFQNGVSHLPLFGLFKLHQPSRQSLKANIDNFTDFLKKAQSDDSKKTFGKLWVKYRHQTSIRKECNKNHSKNLPDFKILKDVHAFNILKRFCDPGRLSELAILEDAKESFLPKSQTSQATDLSSRPTAEKSVINDTLKKHLPTSVPSSDIPKLRCYSSVVDFENDPLHNVLINHESNGAAVSDFLLENGDNFDSQLLRAKGPTKGKPLEIISFSSDSFETNQANDFPHAKSFHAETCKQKSDEAKQQLAKSQTSRATDLSFQPTAEKSANTDALREYLQTTEPSSDNPKLRCYSSVVDFENDALHNVLINHDSNEGAVSNFQFMNIENFDSQSMRERKPTKGKPSEDVPSSSDSFETNQANDSPHAKSFYAEICKQKSNEAKWQLAKSQTSRATDLGSQPTAEKSADTDTLMKYLPTSVSSSDIPKLRCYSSVADFENELLHNVLINHDSNEDAVSDFAAYKY